MKKILSFCCLFLLIFIIFNNTKLLIKNDIYRVNYLFNKNKYKNINQLNTFEGEINFVSKTEDYSLYFVNNEKYFILNNKNGIYFEIDELNNLIETTGFIPKLVGYDEQNNVWHFRSYDSNLNQINNYFYDLDNNNLTCNENNYKVDDNVVFEINNHPGWNVTYTLDINHSNSSYQNWSIYLEDQFWNIGKDPFISNINYLNYSDNLFEINIDSKNSNFKNTYFIDLEDQNYWTIDQVPNYQNLINIKGNYFIYNNEIYDWTSQTTLITFSSSSFLNNNSLWSTPLNDYAILIDDFYNVSLIDFNNYNDAIIYNNLANIKNDKNLTKNKYIQDDKGNFYILEQNKNFKNNTLSLIESENGTKFSFDSDSNLDQLISANSNNSYDNNILGIDEEKNIIKTGMYDLFGISFLYYGNYFIDENSLYIDDKNLVIKINNNAIHYVYLNNQKITPSDPNAGIWRIDLGSNSYLNQEKFKLELDFYNQGSKKYILNINEIIDYMPKISIKSDYENNINKNVYYDPYYYQNEGLIDGYYSKYQKQLKISNNDFYFIDQLYINNELIDNNTGDIDEIKQGTYNLFNDKKITKIKIIDKFEKEWNYQIYNYNEPKKYWTETLKGIETSRKANFLNIDYLDLNAYQTYNLSIDLLDTFDLSLLNIYDGDPSFATYVGDFLQDDLFFDSIYNSRIPINQYTIDQSIKDLTDLKGNTNLSFRTWYEHWTIDAINDVYDQHLIYGDIEWVLDSPSVQNNNEPFNQTNLMGHFESTEQGLNSKRVVGKSNSDSQPTTLLESIKISCVNNDFYLTNFNIFLDNEFDNITYSYNDDFSKVKQKINDVVYETIIYYNNVVNLGLGFDFSKASEDNISIEHLNFYYYDQNGKEIKDNTPLKNIDSISIKVVGDDKAIFVNSDNPEMYQVIRNIDFDFVNIEQETFLPQNNSTWIWFLIVILINFLILIFIILFWFFKNRKNNKIFKIDK